MVASLRSVGAAASAAVVPTMDATDAAAPAATPSFSASRRVIPPGAFDSSGIEVVLHADRTPAGPPFQADDGETQNDSARVAESKPRVGRVTRTRDPQESAA